MGVSPASSNNSTSPLCSALAWAFVKNVLSSTLHGRDFLLSLIFKRIFPAFILGLCVHEGDYILSQSELTTALKQIQVGRGQNTLEYLND